MTSISLCMIVKNEEKNLPECLENIKDVVDETIVVDTGSSDNTIEVAKRLGARVYHFKWCDDFSAARNESIRHATGDYIIYLDADDRIDKENAEKLLRLKRDLPEAKDMAYSLKIVLPSPKGLSNSAYQFRLFPNLPGIQFERPIHEQITPSLKRKEIKGIFSDISIQHMGYREPWLLRAKAERNLRILQRELAKDPEDWFVHYFLAQTYEVLGENLLQEEHLKKTIVDECKKADENWYVGASLKYSQILLKRGEIERAKRLLLGLEEELPKWDIIKFSLAEMDFKTRDYSGALNRYIAIRPERLTLVTIPLDEEDTRCRYYLHLAECYKRLGYHGLAKGAYIDAYELVKGQPSEKEVLTTLIGLLIKEGRLGEALPYIEELSRLDPTARSYTLLGLAHMDKEDWDQAAPALEAALSLDPHYHPARLWLAEVNIRLQRFKEAQEMLGIITANGALPNNKLTAHLMLAFIHASELKLDELIVDTDFILKHLDISVSVNSLEGLSNFYIDHARYLTKYDAYWARMIGKKIQMIGSGIPNEC